jgi:hypothetical protein
MKDALRAKDAVRLAPLRSIRAAFLNELKKDNSTELSDQDCIPVLRRLEKQRKESIEAFESAGRTEQADVEKGELAVIEGYLPSLADEATTRGWVQAAIEQAGVSDPKQLGKVMGMLMKEHKGEVDAGLAKKLAGELLAG